MNKIFDDGSTRVYLSEIDFTCGNTRGERERAAVQRIVAELFGPEAVIVHDADGAPSLAGVASAPFISISHSMHHAVLAVDPGYPVGVDVEEPREQLRRVAPRVLPEAELAAYSDRLLEAWTLKEAIYKCAGRPGLDFRADIRLPLGNSPAHVGQQCFDVLMTEILPDGSMVTTVRCL